MLIVSAVSKYKSILPFNIIELPDLSIIIGINGSGKTHFLEAIKSGKFTVRDADVPIFYNNDQITLLVNNLPADSGITESVKSSVSNGQNQDSIGYSGGIFGQYSFYQIKEHILKAHKNNLSILNEEIFNSKFSEVDIWAYELEILRNEMQQIGIEFELDELSNIFEKARNTIKLPHTPVPHPRVGRGVFETIEAQVQKFSNAVQRVADYLEKDILKVTEQDLLESSLWGSFNIFDPAIGKIIVAYRDARAKNDIEYGARSREEENSYLDEKDFIKFNGLPPWLEISNILEQFGLPYKVKPPSSKLDLPYVFLLVRNNNGVEVDFQSLSGGEKILIRFALSVFQFYPFRVSLITPKLLLLDEMDASLHPVMVHTWLNAIENALVANRGIKCILTTHSPTTVALAPEGALYEIQPDGAGPQKVSKQQALNKLTVGLPSLSIDFDGRRQVFVESRTDALVYDIITNLLKNDLDLHRTLTFMATGPSSGKSERNTGSTIVEYIVEKLAENSNKTVYGILDWDRKHKGTDRIKIIGDKSHYALDNIIMNPLLIGVLLLRHTGPVQGVDVSLNDLSNLAQDKAQKLADAIQNKVIYPKNSFTGFVKVELIGGLEIEVRNEFALSNGHDMEAALAAAFPSLNRYQPSTPGNLNKAVADHVLTEWKYLTPKLIADIIKEIANQDVS